VNAGPRPDEVVIGGRRAVAEAIRSGAARRVLVADDAKATQGLRALLEAAERAGLSVLRVPSSDLDRWGAARHQGVVAAASMPRPLDEGGLKEFAFGPVAPVVVLDGIMDPHNLGACARSAEAAGAALLVIRERRAAPLSPAAVRASAGALLHLPVARVVNLTRALELLKDRGFTVVGLDGRGKETVAADPPPPPVALVVGAEDEGISRLVRESCDLLVAIPLRGRTASLNASAALAIGLFGYVLRGTMPGDAGVAQPGSASDL
jgi:23S rRNA (guanosine2251-2'-O)-methyltransferase